MHLIFKWWKLHLPSNRICTPNLPVKGTAPRPGLSQINFKLYMVYIIEKMILRTCLANKQLYCSYIEASVVHSAKINLFNTITAFGVCKKKNKGLQREHLGFLASEYWLIDCIVFYAVSAIFQPYNGGAILNTILFKRIHQFRLCDLLL